INVFLAAQYAEVVIAPLIAIFQRIGPDIAVVHRPGLLVQVGGGIVLRVFIGCGSETVVIGIIRRAADAGMRGKMTQKIYIGEDIADDMVVLVDVILLLFLDCNRVLGIARTLRNGAGIVARDIVYRDDVGDLIGGVDRVRAIDAQGVEVARVAFVKAVEIFADMDVIIQQGEAGIGPYSIAFQLGIDEGAILVRVVERKEIGGLAGASADGDVMALHGGRFKDVFEPVVAVAIGQRNMIGIQVIIRQAGIGSVLWCACRRNVIRQDGGWTVAVLRIARGFPIVEGHGPFDTAHLRRRSQIPAMAERPLRPIKRIIIYLDATTPFFGRNDDDPIGA